MRRCIASAPLFIFALLLTFEALAAPPLARARGSKSSPVKRDEVEGGRHWRIQRDQGVIHVWRPYGYRSQRAGIVLYVHGYHMTADSAWRRHQLAKQFRASQQNALFVVVDGPSKPGERIKFESLSKVLHLVARYSRNKLPSGHIVALVHSAGYRTLVKWLDYRYLSHVILLDALYADEDDFLSWMTTARHHDWHRLTAVAKDTKVQCQRLRKKLKGRHLKQIPGRYADLARAERSARALFLDSQYSHSALSYNGKVIPMLLRRTRLRLIK